MHIDDIDNCRPGFDTPAVRDLIILGWYQYQEYGHDYIDILTCILAFLDPLLQICIKSRSTVIYDMRKKYLNTVPRYCPALKIYNNLYIQFPNLVGWFVGWLVSWIVNKITQKLLMDLKDILHVGWYIVGINKK